MQVMKGDRVDTMTLVSLGFKFSHKEKGQQIWYCGSTMLGLSIPQHKSPIVMWVNGIAGYIGNVGRFAFEREKGDCDYPHMRATDIRQRLRGVEDGQQYARKLFGY